MVGSAPDADVSGVSDGSLLVQIKLGLDCSSVALRQAAVSPASAGL